MTRDDVKEGDDVKNGRSGAWGRVVAIEASDTGSIQRLRVRRHIGLGALQWEPVWWHVGSVVMVEKRPPR